MSSKRILVIEDDPDGSEMVTTLLQHMAFTVDSVDDGDKASQLLSTSGSVYNAVIIDLALPGKDGWELLNEILNNPSLQHIPCIAVTAFHNSKLREEALKAGFTAYFPKPIDGTQLGRELDRIL